MRPRLYTRCLGSLGLASFLVTSSLFAATGPVVIDITRSPREGSRISIDGKATKASELLDQLGAVAGPARDVLVLARPETSLRDLMDLRAILDKAGYQNLRFYIYQPERQLMSEVQIDDLGIPYTLSPPKRSD